MMNISAQQQPIVCTLTDAEFREREAELLDEFRELAAKVSETTNGYIYEFPFTDDSLSLVTELIRLEGKCCKFIDFLLNISPSNGQMSLELSGTIEAKPLINEIFNK